MLVGGIVVASMLVFTTPAQAQGFIGWKYTNSNWYYYKDGATVKNAWEKEPSGKYYWLGGNGAMAKNQWILTNSYYYLNSKGERGDCVIVAKKGGAFTSIQKGGAFTSIQKAIDSLPKSPWPFKILVDNGTYYENLTTDTNIKYWPYKNITLVGVNKATCIIRDDSGNMSNSPLRISGGGSDIKNLTFISTHDKSNYKVPSYAVQIGGGSATGMLSFYNCKFISYQNSAVGVVTHSNQNVTFTECDFTKYSDYNAGALYCHNAIENSWQQYIFINDCTFHSTGYEMRIDDANMERNGTKSPLLITFKQDGVPKPIIDLHMPSIDGGVSGQVTVANH